MVPSDARLLPSSSVLMYGCPVVMWKKVPKTLTLAQGTTTGTWTSEQPGVTSFKDRSSQSEASYTPPSSLPLAPSLWLDAHSCQPAAVSSIKHPGCRVRGEALRAETCRGHPHPGGVLSAECGLHTGTLGSPPFSLPGELGSAEVVPPKACIYTKGPVS